MGEGIEECVRAAVVGFGKGRGHGRDGRKQDEEIQVRIRQQVVENPSAGDFGRENALGEGACFHLDHSRADDAGGMDHAMDGAELLPGRRENRAHRFAVGCLGHHDFDFRAEAFDLDEFPERPRNFRRRVGANEEVFPLRLFGKGMPLRQDEPRLTGLGEVAGHSQPDAASATGDEVNAAVAQPIGTGMQGDGKELPPPAVRAPVGQHLARDGPRELGENPPAMVFAQAIASAREIEVEAGDVRKLLWDHAARTQRCRHRGIEFLVADDLMNSAGNHGHFHRRADVEFADGLRDLHQTEEAEILRAFAGGGIAGVGGVIDASEMHDVDAGPTGVFDFAKELAVIFGRARHPEADDFDCGAGLSQHIAEAMVVSVAVREDEPHDPGVRCAVGDNIHESGSFPRGDVEPAVESERGGLLRDCLRFVSLRFDPVILPFKRIGGQGNFPARRVAVQFFPADLCAGEPQPSDRVQEHLDVGLVLVVMAERWDGRRVAGGLPVGVLHREDAQRLSRPGFQEERAFHLPDGAQRVIESRGVMQMPRPIGRIDGLGLGNPSSGHIGNERNLRRIQSNLPHLHLELAHERVEQSRVKRMRVLHGPVDHAAGGERPGEFLDRWRRAGDDAQIRAVDERDREVAREQGLKFGFRQGYREHAGGRKLIGQLRAPHDQVQCVLERKHAGQTGRDIFAHAVSDDGLRHDAEVEPEPGERVLDGEKGGLQMGGLVEPPAVFVVRRRGVAGEHFFQVDAGCRRGLLPGAIFRVENVADVEAEVRAEDFRAAIDLLAEDGEGCVKLAAHADVMIADAGQQQDERAFCAVVHARDGEARGFGGEGRDGSGAIRGDDKATVQHGSATGLQRESRVVQIDRGVPFQKFAQPFRGCGEG